VRATAVSEFARRVEAAEHNASAPCSCLVLPRDLAAHAEEESEEEEHEQLSDATHLALTIAAGYKEESERLVAHVLDGKGETNAIRMRLAKGNTDTGSLQLQILMTEFATIKAEHCACASKLVRTLALLKGITASGTWLHDTEYFDEMPRFVADVATYVRTNLLKKTDSQLGIGLLDASASANTNGGGGGDTEDAPSPTRLALHSLLDVYKTALEGEGQGVRFNWLARKRARRSSGGEAARNVRGG
jgi:hypothetical protein